MSRNAFSNYPQSINQSIQSVKDDYTQFITKPPERNVTHGVFLKILLLIVAIEI